MPMFILGGKGSGKTHLMRYCSYQIQKLRFEASGKTISQGVEGDGYIGIYVPCGGLRSGRFAGKGQSTEAWTEVFAYYTELWLGRALLRILPELIQAGDAAPNEARLCKAASKLFDANAPSAVTIAQLAEELEGRQRSLDYQINNTAFTGKLEPDISVTRGRLIFGLPEIIGRELPFLRHVLFTYQLDQFEDLTVEQQKHVNTLVRERESPATFKIGGRSFGVKTRATFSADEENLKDSEYEELRLDEQFRGDKERYGLLARRLLQRRLDEASERSAPSSRANQDLASYFEAPDLDWRSPFFLELVGEKVDERVHIQALAKKLEQGRAAKCAPGIVSEDDIKWVMESVAVPDYPLLERLNLLFLYQAWAKGLDLTLTASGLRHRAAEFVSGKADLRYKQKLSHYKSDLVAQLLRENRHPQLYAGLGSFIDMSEGQPRALLTLLKQIHDWSDFQGEQPFVRGEISAEAQRKGAAGAADWFYNSMTKAGRDGTDIIICIDRLAELFRLNRFADNPTECSLIGFSGSVLEANDQAQKIIRLAKERSFLVEISGGQNERNSERVTAKLQLNRMLVPRWRLPTGRRGIVSFGSKELNAIFDPENSEAFQHLRAEWEGGGNAPYFGKFRGKVNSDKDSDHLGIGQSDLFSDT